MAGELLPGMRLLPAPEMCVWKVVVLHFGVVEHIKLSAVPAWPSGDVQGLSIVLFTDLLLSHLQCLNMLQYHHVSFFAALIRLIRP